MNRKMKVVYFSFSLEFFTKPGLALLLATKSILLKSLPQVNCMLSQPQLPAWTCSFSPSLLNNIPLSLTLNILARHCYVSLSFLSPCFGFGSVPLLLLLLCCCTWLDCQLQFKNLIVWQCCTARNPPQIDRKRKKKF